MLIAAILCLAVTALLLASWWAGGPQEMREIVQPVAVPELAK